MTQEAYIQQIQTQVEEGNLEKALKLLQEFTNTYRPRQRNDAAGLKATFLNAKRQFEVKGLMTRQEYDLVFARTVNGIQTIIGEEEETKASPAQIKPKSKRWIWLTTAGVLLFIVLPFSSYFYLKRGMKSLGEQTEMLLDTIRQENTSVEIPEEAIPVTTGKETPPKQKKTNPKASTIPEKEDLSTITNTTKEEKPIEQQEEPPQKVVEYLEVKLIVNADYSDAQIFVDGEAATVIQDTPIIKTIQVEKKSDMHRIELRNGERPCTKNLLIATDGQKVTMNC